VTLASTAALAFAGMMAREHAGKIQAASQTFERSAALARSGIKNLQRESHCQENQRSQRNRSIIQRKTLRSG
jgi:hypothetical protein